MTVTSFNFFLFLIVGGMIYYMMPGKVQWIVLLCLSFVFYFFAGTPYTIIFIFISTVLAYVSTLTVDLYNNGKCTKKIVTVAVTLAVSLNIIMWFVLKGTSFWSSGFALIHRLFPSVGIPQLQLVAALGMGYYTAQTIGYILDVYWGISKAEKNPFKLLLFIAFFPQLIVGPISKFSQMQCLYEKHKFNYKNICFGAQRIVWGLFKVLVISERVGLIVSEIWEDKTIFFGVWPWIATLLYPIVLYTDFSGCMDIILGAAEIFDIKLPENFNNPFSARSVQEFWQRWHITLGTWAKDYVYYPVLKSKLMIKLGKWSKKHFNKRTAKLVPWTLGMGVLWFVMGFWHGSIRHIIGVGIWYWSILVAGEFLKPVFEKIIHKLGIDKECFSWKLFQQIRTYVIFAIGCVCFSSSSMGAAVDKYKSLICAFGQINPWTLLDGTILKTGVIWHDINIIIIGIALMFVVAYLKSRYTHARNWVEKQVLPFRWLIWYTLIMVVIILGHYGPGYDASQFIYQGF